MNDPARTFALIPAAGQSRRMGRCKLALPLGDRSVLEWVIGALRRAGIEHIFVVVGPHVAELVPLAERAGAQALLLTQQTADMRATIERGLEWLEERLHPHAGEDWLLVPGDLPTLDVTVIRQMLAARADAHGQSIIVPSLAGRRGHPTLIGWRHVAAIRALPAGTGLNSYLRQQGTETLELPVASADILGDLDTPEDYQRLQRRWEEVNQVEDEGRHD
jgi:molybdenum cofactor cytidylyltransferase